MSIRRPRISTGRRIPAVFLLLLLSIVKIWLVVCVWLVLRIGVGVWLMVLESTQPLVRWSFSRSLLLSLLRCFYYRHYKSPSTAVGCQSSNRCCCWTVVVGFVGVFYFQRRIPHESAFTHRQLLLLLLLLN